MALDDLLLGSWDLTSDGRDVSGHGRHAEVRGQVAFGPSSNPAMPGSVARILLGRGHLEVPAIDRLGTSDFTLSAWVNPSTRSMAALGDIASFFDPIRRRGFELGFQHRAVCGSHGNDRNLFFGIDSGSEPQWTNHGSPAKSAVMIYAFAVLDDVLYTATWEESDAPRGHVYRRDGHEWVDCGSPWDTNAVTRLAVYQGRLYAGVSRIKGGGSGRPDSRNPNPGGRIFRYEGGTDWSDQGALEGADSIGALVPYDGVLYAIPLYSQGIFRMSTPGRWEWCGTPGRRLLALGVHDGDLYGAGNDHVDVESAIRLTAAGVVVPAESTDGGGGVFRYDGGETWTNRGMQPDTTQIYSLETHGGELHISSWPSGLVFRMDPAGAWVSTGRLGDETEVMPLLSYNGMLYAGTLPHAEIHRYDGERGWSPLKRLDTTPDVMYRRAHAMVVFRGELFCGTLPAADVWSMRVGTAVSMDRPLGQAWHHVTAVRAGGAISLSVDGREISSHPGDGDGSALDLGEGQTLRLGGGPQAGLDGELTRVRLHGRALSADEIAALATMGPA
jgi:hypothetical protein